MKGVAKLSDFLDTLDYRAEDGISHSMNLAKAYSNNDNLIVSYSDENLTTTDSGNTFISENTDDECVKKVFLKFCLGGDINDIIKNYHPDEDREKNGMRSLLYRQGNEVTMVSEWKGRTVRIARFYKPGSWLTYLRLQGKLADLYGAGKDDSFFPDYADSQSSKATSISLGKGRAKHVWDQDKWSLSLVWSSNRTGVMLIYYHKALNSDMKENRDEGF